jgi:uncharacterized RDD family membrane protein YckC
MALFKRKKNQIKTASAYNQDALKRLDKTRFKITPPEGVPVSFQRASIGSRFGAQFMDLLITYGGLVLLIFLIGYTVRISWENAVAFFSLVSFLIRIPYYILSELVWNGQTLGKKIVKLRVISASGRRLEPHQVVVRNLLKEAEIFLPISLIFGIMSSSGWVMAGMWAWLLIVILIPVFSKLNQRLGDMIAGTCVVNQPQVKQAKELTAAPNARADRFIFNAQHLEHYGRFELQSLEQILREVNSTQSSYDRDVKVAKTIRGKIGYGENVGDGEARNFLQAFYAAQRAHLEARQMFGDRREDKHHKDDKTP